MKYTKSLPLALHFMVLMIITGTSCSLFSTVSTDGEEFVIPTENPINTEAPLNDNEIDITTEVPTLTLQEPLVNTPTLEAEANYLVHDFVVGYIVHYDDGASQLWNLSPPYQEPLLILEETSDHSFLGDALSWSRDGGKIAIGTVNLATQNQTVTIIDVASREIRDLAFSLGPESNSILSVGPGSWSLDDRWIAVSIRFISSITNLEQRRTILVNAFENQIVELDENIEFEAWSTINPKQYYFVKHLQNEIGATSINIGEVGLDQPIASYDLFTEYVPVGFAYTAWSPIEAHGIAINGQTGQTLFVDFTNQQIEKENSLPGNNPSLWSSNGKWLTLFRGLNVSFWEVGSDPSKFTEVLPLDGLIQPLGWTTNGEVFVFENENIIYTVMPNKVQEIVDILNLKEFGYSRLVVPHIWIP